MSPTPVRSNTPSGGYWRLAARAVLLGLLLSLVGPPATPGQEGDPTTLPTGVWRRVQLDVHQNWTTTTLNSVTFVDDLRAFAVGFDGLILKTGDGGATWGPVPSPTTAVLRAVDFPSDEVGYAAGDGGTVVKTTDGGITWQLLEAPLGDLEAKYHALDFVDERTGWVVGERGAIQRTTDGGTTWVPQLPGTQEWFKAVSFPTAQDGYVATNSGKVFRTTNGGLTWDAMAVPANTGALNGLAFPDPDRPTVGWAVGETVTAGSQRGPLILRTVATSGGLEWEDSFRAPGNSSTPLRALTGLAFRPDGVHGQAVGLQGLVLVSEVAEDGTVSWSAEPADARSGTDQPSSPVINATAWAPGSGDTSRIAVGGAGGILRRTVDANDIPPRDACLLTPARAGSLEGTPAEDPVSDAEDVEVPDGDGDGEPELVVSPLCGAPPTEPPADTRPHASDRPCPVAVPNPEFPCLRAFDAADEKGRKIGAPSTGPLLDHGLRRAVTYFGAPGSVAGGAGRIMLYDLDALEPRGVPGFARYFTGASADGESTGVVSLTDATTAADLPTVPGARSGAVALDATDHILFAGVNDCGVACNESAPPQVIAVSLTGEFEPASHFVPDVTGPPTSSPRFNQEVLLLATDPEAQVLYAVVEGTPRHSNKLFAHSLVSPSVTLHAFSTAEVGQGKLERIWSVPFDGRCHTASQRGFQLLGLSRDGRNLAFGCKGMEGPAWGTPAIGSHGIVAVRLPGDDPASLRDSDTAAIDIHFEPIPAIIGARGSVTTRGAPGLDVLVFRVSARQLFYDFARRMWVGGTTVEGGADVIAADAAPGVAGEAASGRVYLAGEGVGPGKLNFFETANLPAQAGRLGVATGAVTINRGVFDPSTRRLLAVADAEGAEGGFLVFEDRIPRAIAFAAENPDDRTNDIDEERAYSVDRQGASAAYGARLWWTGLGGTLPGTVLLRSDEQSTGINGDPSAEGEPTLTYGWLFTGGQHGRFTSRLPWRPGSNQREVFTARVSETSLSGDLAKAEAVGVSLDDTTDEEAHTRRGVGEWHEAVDSIVDERCTLQQCRTLQEGLDDATEEFEPCVIEGYDRLFREVDGDRRVQGVDDGGESIDCFRAVDDLDPRGDPEDGGLEGRIGFTRSSTCRDPGDSREESRPGSRATCDLSREGAGAASEQSLFLQFPGRDGAGAWLRLDGARSETRTYRDSKLGMVSESTATADGFELGFNGQGSISIGQVRTVARSWANGRPRTKDNPGAGSSFTVAYENVVIKHPNGTEEHYCQKDAPPSAGDCDPKQITDQINRFFPGKLQARAPRQDLDRLVTGSPMGARGMVRRDPALFFSDKVLFDFERWELPGLQFTVIHDGTLFNRFTVDLAAVFTETTYYIGAPIEHSPPSLSVELTDTHGEPLAGGEFEVALDSDDDGILSDGDQRFATCTTGSDGTGDCAFQGIDPGTYFVRQSAAPEGYAPQPDVATVEAREGDAKVTFVNQVDGAGVEVTLVNTRGEPLPDGAFRLTHGGGGGGTCITDAGGGCIFAGLPLGEYVLHQEAAPKGYRPSRDIAFGLDRVGQVARITVVNGRARVGGGGGGFEIIELIDAPPIVSTSSDEGGWWQRIPRSLADIILRNPAQALALALLGLLIGAPAYLAVRRRDLTLTRQVT